MSVLDRVSEDTKKALKAAAASPEAKVELSALRMLSSEIKYKRIALKKEKVDDEDIYDVINAMVKKRKDAADMYTQGGREELAQKEKQEIEFIRRYLPAQLSDEDLAAAVDKALPELGVDSLKQIGKVMGALVPQLKGQAEPSRISALVKAKLTPPPAEEKEE